ncbi:H-NS family nucleoid-associated regulatory protein [Donghicola mangrovi]|uniref:H-NS histone family protein n=1 Tax=Donghicola mangrovi TaxID=2729614 RepID=A0A850PYT5_9RHOB|nr:H-NS histone family protein [Donghicola mangrovi]NVO21986.1 H-NS histone family protein [Donghicola mangrovi]
MDIDLNSLDLSELKKLQKDVDKAINEYQDRRITEARTKLEAEARAMGFSLAELLDGKKKAAAAKSPPRYRHPEDSSVTWTGRGRKPAWVIEHIESGKQMEDLEI